MRKFLTKINIGKQAGLENILHPKCLCILESPLFTVYYMEHIF